MNRTEKIEFIKGVRAGKIDPCEREPEIIGMVFQDDKDPNIFRGAGGKIYTQEQLDKTVSQKSTHAGPPRIIGMIVK